MFAVVQTGGKQYRVAIGQSIEVEKLPNEKGEAIELDRVLLVGEGDQITAGTPLVAGARVVATVSRQFRAPKIVVFRYKSKKRVRVKKGHRQSLTQLFIRDIIVNGESTAERNRPAAAAEPVAPEAEAALPAAEATAAPVLPETTAGDTTEAPETSTESQEGAEG